MGKLAKGPLAAFLTLAISASLMQGCAVAAVGALAGAGAVGYGFTQDPPRKTTPIKPGAPDEPHVTAQPAAQAEPQATSEPLVLVESTAPVEEVEVQRLQ